MEKRGKKRKEREKRKMTAAQQPTFPGLEAPPTGPGFMEMELQHFIETFFNEKRQMTPLARMYVAPMVAICRNIDLQNNPKRPREISRNVDALKNYLDKLQELYEDSDELPPEIAELVKEAKK